MTKLYVLEDELLYFTHNTSLAQMREDPDFKVVGIDVKNSCLLIKYVEKQK